MAIHNLTKKLKLVQDKELLLGPVDNTMRVIKLEKRINDQEQKLDKILELLQNGNNLPNTDKQCT